MYVVHLICPCGYEWLEPATRSPYLEGKANCPECDRAEARDSYTYDYYYPELIIRRETEEEND